MKLPSVSLRKESSLLHQMMERFLLGVAGGLGQALGLTLIFALIVRYVSTLFTTLGGVPYLANIIAKIVEATQKSMLTVN